MEISAKILADNINENGVRITTMELHYHRYILPELNTHRAFSRNGASSRAIPTAKLIEACLNEQVEPLEWGLNQAGMQAFTVADEELEGLGRVVWNSARAEAIRHACKLNELGFAKQIVNRVLEPYLSTRTVVTSTDWANFDTLRDHKDAQPEIRDLAQKMIEQRRNSSPRILATGEWHLPYILPEDYDRVHSEDFTGITESVKKLLTKPKWFTNETLILAMISAARCARVSYRTVEGAPTDYAKDLELFERLVKTQPVHASPTEHQATPYLTRTPLSKNFRTWVPFRSLIAGETVYDG